MTSAQKVQRLVRSWIGVPATPAARRWALVSIVDATGSGMLLPIGVLYFTVVVHLPLETVGLGLGIAGFVGAFATVLAGPLVDRFGAKAAVMTALVVGAAAYFGYLGVQDVWGFLIVVSAAQVAESIARPAKKAFVATFAEAEDRVRLMAFQRSVRNVGYGAGGLITAALFTFGSIPSYHLAVVINGVSFLIAATLVSAIRVRTSEAHPEQVTSAPGQARGYRAMFSDRRYVGLTLANVLVRFHATALVIGLPLWVQHHTHAPTGVLGAFFTLNTVLVVALQVRFVGKVVTAAQTRPVYFAAATAFVLAAAGYSAAGWIDSPAILICIVLAFAVVTHTVAELYASVGEWTVSVDLAPDWLRGRYLSTFSLGVSLHDVIAPAMVTVFIARVPNLSWLLLAALMAGGCCLSALLVTDRAQPGIPDLDPAQAPTTEPTPGTGTTRTESPT